MFHPPSVQSDYTLICSEDPALDLPSSDGKEGEEAEVAASERARLLKVARETGRWDAILKVDAKPTLFKMKPIHDTALTWMRGESRRRDLSEDEAVELAFRLAVSDIENLGKTRPQFERIDGHRLLKPAVVDDIYSIGRDSEDPHLGRRIVIEIGSLALLRAVEGVSPLSSKG